MYDYSKTNTRIQRDGTVPGGATKRTLGNRLNVLLLWIYLENQSSTLFLFKICFLCSQKVYQGKYFIIQSKHFVILFNNKMSHLQTLQALQFLQKQHKNGLINTSTISYLYEYYAVFVLRLIQYNLRVALISNQMRYTIDVNSPDTSKTCTKMLHPHALDSRHYTLQFDCNYHSILLPATSSSHKLLQSTFT